MALDGIDVSKPVDASEGLQIVYDAERNGGQLVMKRGLDSAEESVAYATVVDRLDSTGWIELRVSTGSNGYSNDLKMYAAGYLEGLATARRISQFYSNFMQLMWKDETNLMALKNVRYQFEESLKLLQTNSNWAPGVAALEPADPYWKHARYVLQQLWGLKDGYNTVALPGGVAMISLVDLSVINSNAEFTELLQVYKPD